MCVVLTSEYTAQKTAPPARSLFHPDAELGLAAACHRASLTAKLSLGVAYSAFH